MHRRHLLLAFPVCLTANAQNLDLPLASPVDAVNVYIIPTDGISEEAAGGIARALTKVTGLWIKSTLWMPSDGIVPFAGTNQYPAEDYFPLGARAARMLREVSPRTYYIVLTNRDINSKSQNFRFQYSSHSPMANTSVLSIARLLYTKLGTPASNVAHRGRNAPGLEAHQRPGRPDVRTHHVHRRCGPHEPDPHPSESQANAVMLAVTVSSKNQLVAAKDE